jgi:GntR family transcriptional regulator, transcriptional repressor for pyruvate dehydrogenase complex
VNTPLVVTAPSTIDAIDRPTSADPAARVPKAADLVARRLRGAILRGETPVGQPLAPEAELMERFGVSRPTLRAALHILETESLVEVRRGSRGGTWVRTPSIDVTARRAGAYLQYHRATAEDVHRARSLVEPPAVAILASRRDESDIAKLQATLDEEERAIGDPVLTRTIGERFHTEIVELAGNETLIVFSAMLQEILDLHTARYQAAREQVGGESRAPAMHAEHVRVLELIIAGAVGEAEVHWRTHLDHVRQHTALPDDGNSLDLIS